MTTERGSDPLDVALRHPEPVDTVDPAMTVSEQHLLVGSEWVVAGRLRLRRRIVTERRTIEVDVRREVFEMQGETVDFRDGRLVGTASDGPVVDAPPADPPSFVAVLREEVPVVSFRVRPYERVTVTVQRVEGAEVLTDTVQHEQVDLTIHPFHTPEEN